MFHDREEDFKTESRSYSYIIKGDPLGWCGFKENPTSTMWDTYKQIALHFSIALEGQHGSKDKLYGLLSLEASFYFAPSKDYYRKKLKAGNKYYSIKPDTSNLLEFIEKSCSGVIFNPESVIISMSALRFNGKESRTEFTFKEMK